MIKLRFALWVLLLILLSITLAEATVVDVPPVENVVTTKTYSYTSSAIITTENGFVISNDNIVKFSPAGEQEWETSIGQVYGDSGLGQTGDGGYVYVTVNDYALFDSEGADEYSHLHVVKLSSRGDIQWRKTFDGFYHGNNNFIQQTFDGGYILACTTWLNEKDSGEIYIIKLDRDGNKEWEKTLGSPAYESSKFIKQTLDGGYVIAGSRNTFTAYQGYQLYLVKVDAKGNKEWGKALGGKNYESAESVCLTGDGGFAALGFSREDDSNSTFYITKVDSKGIVQWEKKLGRKEDSLFGQRIIQTSEGGFLASGRKQTSLGSSEFYLIKIDSQGNKQWEQSVSDGPDRNIQVLDIFQANSGKYFLVGTSTAIKEWDQRILFIAVKPDLHVVINGKTLALDVLPYIKKGRTMVPLRGIFESLGAEVKWEGKTSKVTAIKDDTTIVLKMGSITAYRNGNPVTLDQPAELVNGRIMVPLRFVGESLGAEVEWDPDERAVLVNKFEQK